MLKRRREAMSQTPSPAPKARARALPPHVWTVQRNNQLKALYAEHGAEWAIIAAKMYGADCPDHLRKKLSLHWTTTVGMGMAFQAVGNWSLQEVALMRSAHQFFGVIRWAAVGRILGGRTGSAVKHRFESLSESELALPVAAPSTQQAAAWTAQLNKGPRRAAGPQGLDGGNGEEQEAHQEAAAAGEEEEEEAGDEPPPKWPRTRQPPLPNDGEPTHTPSEGRIAMPTRRSAVRRALAAAPPMPPPPLSHAPALGAAPPGVTVASLQRHLELLRAASTRVLPSPAAHCAPARARGAALPSALRLRCLRHQLCGCTAFNAAPSPTLPLPLSSAPLQPFSAPPPLPLSHMPAPGAPPFEPRPPYDAPLGALSAAAAARPLPPPQQEAPRELQVMPSWGGLSQMEVPELELGSDPQPAAWPCGSQECASDGVPYSWDEPGAADGSPGPSQTFAELLDPWRAAAAAQPLLLLLPPLPGCHLPDQAGALSPSSGDFLECLFLEESPSAAATSAAGPTTGAAATGAAAPAYPPPSSLDSVFVRDLRSALLGLERTPSPPLPPSSSSHSSPEHASSSALASVPECRCLDKGEQQPFFADGLPPMAGPGSSASCRQGANVAALQEAVSAATSYPPSAATSHPPPPLAAASHFALMVGSAASRLPLPQRAALGGQPRPVDGVTEEPPHFWAPHASSSFSPPREASPTWRCPPRSAEGSRALSPRLICR